jgi:hypothetical protein
MEFNHQLESRMPEIGLFGSGGGALLKRRPYLISAQGFNLGRQHPTSRRAQKGRKRRWDQSAPLIE